MHGKDVNVGNKNKLNLRKKSYYLAKKKHPARINKVYYRTITVI